MFHRLWCLLTGHSWQYVCSFSTGIAHDNYPHGGFRIRCIKCGKKALVWYPENLEMKVEKL